MMSYEETLEPYPEIQEEGSGLESGTIDRLAMLRLNSTTDHQHHHPRTTVEKCKMCGSMKRRSPSSLSAVGEPSSKRANLNLQSPSSLTKVPPISTTGGTPPPRPPPRTNLYRSFSDTINSAGTPTEGPSNQFLNAQSPDTAKVANVSASPSPTTASLPPLPQPLQRSLSEPVSSDRLAVMSNSTPPRPPGPGARSFRGSPTSGGSPNTKRLLQQVPLKLHSNWDSSTIPQ